MITIELDSGLKLKFIDDANELAADRYKDFQKYQLIDGGVGCTIEDVGDRYGKLFKLLNPKYIKEAQKEAENLYYTHYFIIEKINFKHLSFALLIHSIDDNKIVDYSEENLTKIISYLSSAGLTQEILEQNLLNSKKNSSRN